MWHDVNGYSMTKELDSIVWELKKHNMAMIMDINELTLQTFIKDKSSQV